MQIPYFSLQQRYRKAVVGGVLLLSASFVFSSPGPGSPRWFGLSTDDLKHPERFYNVPLRVKAKFVRGMDDAPSGRPAGKGKAQSFFLVDTPAGPVRCEAASRGRGVKRLRHMKRGTPVILFGTLRPKANVLFVDRIIQGWGVLHRKKDEQ
jgi:hypothetical protein